MKGSKKKGENRERAEPGFFMEFCEHDSWGCGYEPYIDNLTLVVGYSVIIEGMPGFVDSEGLLEYDLFSTRTIIDFVPLATKANLTVCVYFRLRSPLCRNLCFYPCTRLAEDLEIIERGTFHLLLITHKFPALQKELLQVDISLVDPLEMLEAT